LWEIGSKITNDRDTSLIHIKREIFP
jgi:hypothetical protein